ncbi:hypothetical protein TESG_02998 [Trichophyton tonsurans CBS 112818]|uniref:Uncharacterized protein n=2 Tax=Trichophyton TaxID=5550 RepID=F2PVA3_TRIEC|nr:hypothetical protein TESG_02998 [Trichophyton tonsurans CBS 112818]EGE05821.1 hypothetical protein TEQG_04830 [Trichophyton equinum CBS 127.97]
MARARDVDEIFNVEALEGINFSMSAPFRKLSKRLFSKKKKNGEEPACDEAPGEEAAGESTPGKSTKSDEEENDSLSSLTKIAPPVDRLHPLGIIEGPTGPILPHGDTARYRRGVHRAVTRLIIEAHQRPDPGPSYPTLPGSNLRVFSLPRPPVTATSARTAAETAFFASLGVPIPPPRSSLPKVPPVIKVVPEHPPVLDLTLPGSAFSKEDLADIFRALDQCC